jgi:hypothetical protein
MWPAWGLDLALRDLSGAGDAVMYLVEGVEHAFLFGPGRSTSHIPLRQATI